MRLRYQKYVPDNGAVKGFGGLLMTPRLARVVHRSAREAAMAIAIQAAASEARATGAKIAPGHVTETFGNLRRRGYVEQGVGYPGAIRRAVRLEATGTYVPGDRDERGVAYNVKSDPIVLEAGSKHEEGTKMKRPALRVMYRGLKKWGETVGGVRVTRGAKPSAKKG